MPRIRHLNDVIYGKGGDTPLLLDLVIPDGSPETLRPTVVWVHGGGWLNGDKSTNQMAWLAAHGYVVASIEYRLSPEAKFPAQIHDCKAAIRFLRERHEQYGIDPERIGVAGESAGAHLAALLGVSGGVKDLEGDGGRPGYSSRVQAVCDIFGPTDFTRLAGDIGPLADPVAAALGGRVEEKTELARLMSPVTYVDPGNPPFLIIHGDQDDIVPLEQSGLLYDLLKKAGVDVTLIKVKNGGHGFIRPDIEPSLQQIDEEILKFFDRTLRPTK